MIDIVRARYKIKSSMRHCQALLRHFSVHCPVRRVFFTFFVLVFSLDTALLAQTRSSEPGPQVQTLYAQAKAAEAGGDLTAAIAKYQSILKISPRLGAAYNNLGSLYLQQREYGKAVEILERGLKIDPAMSSTSALLGISFYEMGNYSAARPRLEAALRANRADTHAELFLANDLIKLGEPEAAALHLQQIARRDPKNQEAWYLLGTTYMKLSEQALAKLNEIAPDSVLVHEVSGEIMESMKNYDGALAEYKKAVELAPQNAGTHYRLGSAYWQLSMWDPATKEFQAELVNDPRNCAAQWKLGNILLEQRLDAEQALGDINRALEMCPTLMPARVDRARALLKLGRNAEALPDLMAAEKADPSAAQIHFFLAQAYRALGRTKDAQAEMQIFGQLEEHSRAATAARAEELLKNKENPPTGVPGLKCASG